MSNIREPARIVGAGPTGVLLAILLERLGYRIELYETRTDPRHGSGEAGRSINLAMASRGIHALKLAGVFESLAGDLIPMRGRLIHDAAGHTSLQPYGLRPDELVYSISRHRLNQRLVEVAASRPGITLRFEHRFEAADFDEGIALIRDLRRDRLIGVPMEPLLAADGAGSALRRRMSSLGLIEAQETDLEHGYKELSIPARPGGGYAMAADALHIWPRGNFMLMECSGGRDREG